MVTNNPEVVNNVIGPNLGGKDLMETASKQGGLVPQLINLMGESAPWLVGLLSVCALAAMQSTGAAYMSTAGGMITRDIVKRYLLPNASDNQQKLFGRFFVIIIVALALLVAATATDALSFIRRFSCSIWFSNVASSYCNMLLAMAYKFRYNFRINCWTNCCNLY